MVLQYFGIKATQKNLARLAHTTHERGTSHRDILRVFRSYGFQTQEKEFAAFATIRRTLKRRVPVIVNWYSPFSFPAEGHYSVVIDINRSTITLADPEMGTARKIKLHNFAQLWFDFAGDVSHAKAPVRVYVRWMMIAIPIHKSTETKKQKST